MLCTCVNALDSHYVSDNSKFSYDDSIKTIGIVSALEEESDLIKNNMTNLKTYSQGNHTFYYGQIGNYNIVLVQCGVGKVSASDCTQSLIDKFDVDCVINTGTAGSLADDVHSGDIVISNSTVEWDLDITEFNQPRGYITSLDQVYLYPSEKLINGLESAVLDWCYST